MLDNDVKRLYNLIIETAMRFLHQASHTPIQFLVEENPTYQDIAYLIEDTRKIIHGYLLDHDPTLASQAIDYCDLMLKIGEAINAEDEEALKQHCETLDRKPFFAA